MAVVATIHRYPAERLHIFYPDQLPITAKVEAIKRELIRSQVLIVCGATASGKTTQLPKIAFGHVPRGHVPGHVPAVTFPE